MIITIRVIPTIPYKLNFEDFAAKLEAEGITASDVNDLKAHISVTSGTCGVGSTYNDSAHTVEGDLSNMNLYFANNNSYLDLSTVNDLEFFQNYSGYPYQRSKYIYFEGFFNPARFPFMPTTDPMTNNQPYDETGENFKVLTKGLLTSLAISEEVNNLVTVNKDNTTFTITLNITEKSDFISLYEKVYAENQPYYSLLEDSDKYLRDFGGLEIVAKITDGYLTDLSIDGSFTDLVTACDVGVTCLVDTATGSQICDTPTFIGYEDEDATVMSFNANLSASFSYDKEVTLPTDLDTYIEMD